ncbi:MAG: hypothetical protein ACYCTB_05800 [bacterium]
MNTYNNNNEVTVKDSLIGEGEKFEIRMNKFTFFTYLISIALSLGIPYLFLDWFYKWKIWPKLNFIESILKSNYSGKWQYFSYIYNNNAKVYHTADMLIVYFYIVAVVFLLIITLKIAKKIIKDEYNRILNTEAKYKNEIARRRNK